MKGISIEAGKIEIVNDARVIASTDGTLVCLLPTVETMSGVTANFPDLAKDFAYLWEWAVSSAPTSPLTYAKQDTGTSFITAVPQEYFQTQTLMAAPSGADFFAGRIRLNRTTNPSPLNWNAQSSRLGVIPPQNVWIPFMGGVSIQLEAEEGFARMLHVQLSGGNLVLSRQQSVSVAPAGYGNFGDNQPSGNVLSGSWSGGRWDYGTTRGLLISRRAGPTTTSRANTATSGGTELPAGTTASPITDRRYGSSGAVTVSDNTDLRSVYTVDIVGRFGRRS